MDLKRLKKPIRSYSRGYIDRLIKKQVRLKYLNPSCLSTTSHTSSSSTNNHISLPNNISTNLNSIQTPSYESNVLLNGNLSPLANSEPSLETNNSCKTNYNSCNYSFCENKEEIFIDHLTGWAVKNHISHNAFNELLQVLRSDLKLNKIPRDCRTLLKINKPGVIQNIQPGNYYHFGLSNGIIESLKHLTSFQTNTLLLSLNVDGLPLTKSSNSQFWPILAQLENVENCRPFAIGVYQGTSKPDNANDFLSPFVNELKIIQERNLSINDQKFIVKVSKILCDAPAKAFILNVKNHNAYHGCTKCHVEGDFLKNRMAFLDSNSPVRSNEEFQNQLDDDYHKGPTVLSGLGIDLVKDVPLDYMHLVCLGVMKKLLVFWVRGSQGIRLFKEDLDAINGKLEKYRKSCVKEFARLPRSLKELDRWKATEFRQFLLYYGPWALKSFLKEPMWSHFLSLHVAMRILTSQDLCSKQDYIDYAEKLLNYFVDKFGDIYGAEYVNHNVHNLIHLCNDVRRFGSLDNFSCFAFEGFMYEIKKTLKTSNYPLQQFINRYYEFITYCSKYNPSKESKFTLLYEDGCETRDQNVILYFKELKCKHFHLTMSEPNCYCFLKNQHVAKVLRFFERKNEYFIECDEFPNVKDYFDSPCRSLLLGCGRVESIQGEKNIYPYAVIHFDNQTISVVPLSWIDKEKMECVWPKKGKDLRTSIIKMQQPQLDWSVHKVTKIYGSFATYESALEEEKILCASSESEDALDRAPGKRKVKSKSIYSPPPYFSSMLVSTLSDSEEQKSNPTMSTHISSESESSLKSSIILETCSPLNDRTLVQEDIQIDVVDVEVSNNDIKFKLEEIQETLNLILMRLNNLETKEVGKSTTVEKIKQYLPCDTLASLLLMEEALQEDDLKQELYNKLLQIGGRDGSSFVRRGLANVLTNRLGTMCSWTGQKNNYKIQGCIFSKVLYDAAYHIFHLTECEYQRIVMDWFRHSGSRMKRENL